MVVLGATGQLGIDVVKVASARGLDVVGLGHEEVDVTEPESVAKAVASHEPAVVVNCAAYHQVDRCEETPTQAYVVNAAGSYNVARACDEVGTRLVYVSTDYVFHGGKPTPTDGELSADVAYMEADAPGPVNSYGMSKLAGERLAAAGCEKALVVRVASLFGVAGARGKGGNFVETMLAKAKEGAPLKVVADQWMSPTYTRDAAEAILNLIDAGITSQTVHAANAGATTWHAFAAEAIRTAGLDHELAPISSSEYPSKARRPANSSLLTDRLADLTGTRLRPWREALAAYLQEKGHI